MVRMNRVALVAFCSLALAAAPSLAAHSHSGDLPSFRGDWHPVVGAGAVYQVEGRGQPAMSWEIAVVGKEQGAYWIENRMAVPEESIMKMLVSPGAPPKRMIVKAAGQPAMELPVLQAQGLPETNLKQTAKLVGKEQVSTPAGSFACDHYQMSERGGTTDVWVTAAVSPYGLVKMTSRDTTVTLAKVVKGAKTRITETPQKMDIPQLTGLGDLMGGRDRQ